MMLQGETPMVGRMERNHLTLRVYGELEICYEDGGALNSRFALCVRGKGPQGQAGMVTIVAAVTVTAGPSRAVGAAWPPGGGLDPAALPVPGPALPPPTSGAPRPALQPPHPGTGLFRSCSPPASISQPCSAAPPAVSVGRCW